MNPVSIIGIGYVPVQKHHSDNLRTLGAHAVRAAMRDAGIEKIDALYVGNMLSDELQQQKHLAADGLGWKMRLSALRTVLQARIKRLLKITKRILCAPGKP